MAVMTLLERVVVGAGCLLVVTFVATTVLGGLVVTAPRNDGVSSADAVIVLGGEHDGREMFGIEVAQTVGAATVLLSDPYAAADPLMRQLCGETFDDVDVLCVQPEPSTTRGEALAARQLAAKEGWRHVVVVSWPYHLRRAELIFEQCYSAAPGSVSMMAVPGQDTFPAAVWQQIYIYQLAAMAKALVQGPCEFAT